MVSEQRGKGPSSPLSIPRASHGPPHPAPTQLGGACPDPKAIGILPPALWFPAHSCDAARREQLSHCLPHPSTAHLCLFAHCMERAGGLPQFC